MGPRYSHKRRLDRKPHARKDRPRRSRRLKKVVPIGSPQEREMSDFLEQLGVRGKSSDELDKNKIDRLVDGVRNASCSCLPIVIQMTGSRNDTGKIKTFIKFATAYLASIGKPNSPLLYMEMRGRPTWKMGKAGRDAIAELCGNPHKDGRRAHGLAIGRNGRSRWFKIQSRQPLPHEDEE